MEKSKLEAEAEKYTDKILIEATDFKTIGIGESIYKAFLAGAACQKNYRNDAFKTSVVSSDGVSVDLHTYTGCYNGIIAKLPKKEAYLLHYFITHKNRVITKKELLDAIWGTDIIVEDRTIDVHVCKVKNKLKLGNLLYNIKGVGYLFNKN